MVLRTTFYRLKPGMCSWFCPQLKKMNYIILDPQHLLQVFYCSSVVVEWTCSISGQWCKAGWKQPASSTVKLRVLSAGCIASGTAIILLITASLIWAFLHVGSFVLPILWIQIVLETQPRWCYNYIPSDITIGHTAVFLNITLCFYMNSSEC